VRRVFAHLDAGTTDRAPDVMRNPIGIYTDPGRFEAEMARIFRRKTLLACLSGRLPGPGSYLAEDLAGVPVLLMRGEDGAARAFLNSCRHRGTRLLDGAGAVRRAFACPYHGWTYGVDGRLTGVPDQEAFEGVDLADCTLATLPCTEAEGLIWIRLSREAPPDPGESLDGLAAEFAGYRLAGYHHYASHRMSNDRHVRLYADGRVEGLEAVIDMHVVPEDPEEAAQAQADFYARNRAVRRMLDAKGFTLDGVVHPSVAINHYFLTGGIDEGDSEP